MSPRDSENPESNGLAESKNELRATEDMCHYCFAVLVHHSLCSEQNRLSTTSSSIKTIESYIGENHKSFLVSSSPSNSNANTFECPLFVTWDKQSGKSDRHYALRGCIGTLSPKRLTNHLGDYALTSALHDTRFNPISISEIPKLRVAVSLLVNYESCDHCYDWIIGTHGIIIKFIHDSKQYSATFLPEVASEQGWDQATTISSLVRKAGFTGKYIDASNNQQFLDSIQCTRYQSSKQYLSYQDYVSSLDSDPFAQTNSTPTASIPENKSGWKSYFR